MDIVKVPPQDLARFSCDVYVDSPIYHTANKLIRWQQWAKLQALLDMWPEASIETCLDLGCGNGVMLPTLSKMCKTVTAVDLYPEAAERLVLTYGLNNVTVTSHIPCEQQRYELIWMSSFVEHIKNLESIMADISSVLKPGGYILWLSPSENWMYQLGRWICSYEKPNDHYYTAWEIYEVLDIWFYVEKMRAWPSVLMPWYIMGMFLKNP